MSKKKNIAVEVKNLTKSFKIPVEASNGIKQKIINVFKGVKGYRTFTPLNDISFEVEEGDFFGIVGRNGSGKSTLLKTIAGIYSPEGGSVSVGGTLVPFIELGVGFNPELTGRENVYLNGALLGFDRAEITAMYNDIVSFAELEDFMDEKLKNYSSGMQVRLAFSIAIKAEGDILLLDEVLAVGDEAFQRKCFSYFAHLKKEKKTVILVTHDMDSVQRFCTKALMLDSGEVVVTGNPATVAQKYREVFMDQAEKTKNSTDNRDDTSEKENNYILFDSKGVVSVDEKKINFELLIKPKIEAEDVVVTLEMIRDNGESVFRWVTDEKIPETINMRKGKFIIINLTIDNIFPDGEYDVQLGVKSRDRSRNFILLPNAIKLSLIHGQNHTGGLRWRPEEKFEYLR